MKFYRTTNNTLINLEKVTLIYKNPNPKDNTYHVATDEGKIFEVPELKDEDIDRIMAYNDYLIN